HRHRATTRVQTADRTAAHPVSVGKHLDGAPLAARHRIAVSEERQDKRARRHFTAALKLPTGLDADPGKEISRLAEQGQHRAVCDRLGPTFLRAFKPLLSAVDCGPSNRSVALLGYVA